MILKIPKGTLHLSCACSVPRSGLGAFERAMFPVLLAFGGGSEGVAGNLRELEVWLRGCGHHLLYPSSFISN